MAFFNAKYSLGIKIPLPWQDTLNDLKKAGGEVFKG